MKPKLYFTAVLGTNMLNNCKHCSKREAKQTVKYLKQYYESCDLWVMDERTHERVYTVEDDDGSSIFIANKLKNFFKDWRSSQKQ